MSPSSPTYSQRPLSPHTVERADLARIRTQSRTSMRSKVPPGSTKGRTVGFGNLSAKDKFRASVRKVMSMRRGTAVLGGGSRIGAEPGVDPRRASADTTYGHIHADCKIEVVDYSSVRSSHRQMGNDEFIDLMEDGHPREPWVKVRWINIGGMSWDVIKAVSIKYNLHPLALEDVFHGHSQNRSKADYYTRHLFLRVLSHELGDDTPGTKHTVGLTDGPRTMSPEPMTDRESTKLDDELTRYTSSRGSIKRNTKPSLLPTSRSDVRSETGNGVVPTSQLSRMITKEDAMLAEREKRMDDEISVEALKQGERVNVKVTPMFFFLFRDGTVISIRTTPNLNFTLPISSRLKSRDTVLRKSADPSLLIHALLDLGKVVVDKALQVIDQYHTNITKFERDILLRPKMNTVRSLHILSGDLILHKRTLEPIKTLVYGLRRYDVDRCAALVDSSDPSNKDVKVVGFMSHKSKIYLADVYDHMDYILTSLDMFAGIAENLINYTFNTASYQMNEVMRRLTLATIIFLPLTILTGYFGMNFDQMWSVHNNSDVFFWELAIPLLILIIPIFMISDLKRLWHYVQKRSESKKAVKEYKQA
ncbi:hypothetical protein B0H34DRAFT_669750 [Crassisporium funariophilum]|nr:hypothetical protein B0H34DRAFT_669750 [Crassisporium funariophilum]